MILRVIDIFVDTAHGKSPTTRGIRARTLAMDRICPTLWGFSGLIGVFHGILTVNRVAYGCFQK